MSNYNEFYCNVCKSGFEHSDWKENSEFLEKLILDYDLLGGNKDDSLLSYFASHNCKEQYDFLLNIANKNNNGLKDSDVMLVLLSLVRAAKNGLSFNEKFRVSKIKAIYSEMIYSLVLSCKKDSNIVSFICDHIANGNSYLFKKSFKALKNHHDKKMIEDSFNRYVNTLLEPWDFIFKERHLREVKDFVRSGFLKDDDKELFLIKFFRNYINSNFKVKKDWIFSTVDMYDFFKIKNFNIKKIITNSWDIDYSNIEWSTRGLRINNDMVSPINIMTKDVNYLLDNNMLSQEDCDIWKKRFGLLKGAHRQSENEEMVDSIVGQMSLKLGVSSSNLEKPKFKV